MPWRSAESKLGEAAYSFVATNCQCGKSFSFYEEGTQAFYLRRLLTGLGFIDQNRSS
jgi:hypothetical protein